MNPEPIFRYFPSADALTESRIIKLYDLYSHWNDQINVVSRKDIANLYINHVLHSLVLSKIIPFREGERVLDIGTGGGFPGIPLAIFHPTVTFVLSDSIGKKIKVVQAIADELQLSNVVALKSRSESVPGKFHYTVSRAVCSMVELIAISKGKFFKKAAPHHGIYALKGGDLTTELEGMDERVKRYKVSSFFEESFFETKSVLFLHSNFVR